MSETIKNQKLAARPLALLVLAIGLVLLLAVVFMSVSSKHPIALLRVVDAAGKPIAGAVIQPEGLRTKPGPYVSGWYGWMSAKNGVQNKPMTTDKNGYAQVPYPKYVFERIETGQICLSVSHPDYVPDRPERIVATAMPAGAPWRVWANDLWKRISRQSLLTHPDPVVLKKGGVLKISLGPASAALNQNLLFAQIQDGGGWDTNLWIRPEPGVIMTRRLAPGPQAVRAVQFDARNAAWFSEVKSITAVSGQTNELIVELKPGVSVRGQLDATVSRPVTRGRVIAHVWPIGHKAEDSPPQWHSWTPVRADGSFEIGSLPPGNLELVALCDGFVSTNGPGLHQMRYPQKYVLGSNDITITIGMEPTVRVEAQVKDDQGNPVKGAHVVAYPNVRYGEWAATILAGDCYNSADWFSLKPVKISDGWFKPVPDFEGISDSAGVAVLPNLPITVNELSVEHPQFAVPAAVTSWGQKHRTVIVTLVAGQANRVPIQLEPIGQTPIAHY